MVPKSLLRIVIADQAKELEDLGGLVPRTLFPTVQSYKGTSAFVIKGVRRCGKSTLLKQIMHTNFSGPFHYLNFDDDRLFGFTSEDFQTLMETFVELYSEKEAVFFDEIQNVPGWELFVNRLLRSGLTVFITGSNANLLSKELGTHLTGRHTDVELFPFSFVEFLRSKSETPDQSNFFTSAQRAVLTRLFNQYLLEGGFPESVVHSNRALLRQIVPDIIQRDILGRHSIRKSAELRTVAKFLMSNASREITYRSISRNFGVGSENTVRKYVEYLSETYLVFEVRRYEVKLKKLEKNPRKIYCVDNGLILSNSPTYDTKNGGLLENLVAVELRRRGKDFYYYRDQSGTEIDFIIPSEQELIQVCFELNSTNREREIKPLLKVSKETKASKLFILTLDNEEELSMEGIKIHVKPVWQWLLENNGGG